uniref:Uncharacterized protein n=1 Tax=Phyllymenia taiwanensis TaxID=1260292 RepID=R9XXS6_9FLOR|nr:hypothetical protein [Grateloupia taiwanensis]AGO19779.1 hypothetical protein [Grateloupia taiwanensis]
MINLNNCRNSFVKSLYNRTMIRTSIIALALLLFCLIIPILITDFY